MSTSSPNPFMPLSLPREFPSVATRLLDAIPDCVCFVDREWRFSYLNRRAFILLGSRDVLGQSINEAFPGNLEEPFVSTYRRAMQEGVAGSFEAWYPAPLNVWFKVRVEPDPDGIFIFFSDVTERKEAEIREHETGERLTQVLDVTTDGILTLDRNWRFTLINRCAAKIMDPGHRFLGKVLWEQFPALLGTEAELIYRRTMDEQVAGDFEFFYPEPLNLWTAVQTQPTAEGIVVFFRDITAQKRHNQLVANQQELLAIVQRAARMATWELDTETGDIVFGPGSFNFCGYTLRDINKVSRLGKILLPGHLPSLRQSVAQAVATGETTVFEFAVLSPAGEVIWVESRAEAVPASAGRAPLLRGMSLDSTQRKLGEADLVASEQRYRVLTDLNPQAIWSADAAGNITYANQGFLTYQGLTADSLTGEGWLQAFSPADRDRVRSQWAISVATGRDYNVEAMIRHAESGAHRYWNLRAAPIRDSLGAITQWLGVGNDIHETKTYAAALRAERSEADHRRSELEAVYSSTPVALALLSPDEFRFLSLNQMEAELLGLPREQIVGRRVQDIAPLPGLTELLTQVAAGSTVKDYLLEGELEPTGNLRRFWSVNYSPVYNDAGRVRAISSAVVEITNQKRAEAALVQSEKLAAVGRLASSISHEINNPLEAITNLLYLVAHDSTLPDELRVYVHLAQSELSRVSQIATQTLRFHRQAVNATRVTPAELVGAVVRLYTGRLSNSSIHIEEDYGVNPHILCFENDIRQVLNNLIANAIDAMRTGGRLVIRARESTAYAGDKARQGVRITIADTGHGMSARVLARVFEPFYTTKDLNGTGLGLWISSGIVERHQGRLTVRSADHPQHHGTIFSLFLPCEELLPA